MEQELNVLRCIIKIKKKYFNRVIEENHEIVSKDPELSEMARRAADGLSTRSSAMFPRAFMRSLAFRQYCNCILMAPAKSEQLALGYERISAFLFHTEKYKYCIRNINCSIEITESDELKKKLIQRKIECLKKLGIVKSDSCLEKVESSLEQLEDDIKKVHDDAISESGPSASNYSFTGVNIDYSLQTKNNINSFSIEFNGELGKYLVATQDFHAGDMILSEKPYCISNNPKTIGMNCNYCLTTAFFGIPCEFCNQAIFCSEECKKKAWELHHHIECSVIPMVEINKFGYIMLALRAVINGIKEAGGISALRDKLTTLDEFSDACLKKLFNDGNFRNTISFIYCFNSKLASLNSKTLIQEVTYIVLFLIAIVKRTNVIENVSSKTIDDLLENEDFRFMGCLMLKLTILIRTKKCGFQIFNPEKGCNFGNTVEKCHDISCCSRGMCLAPITSFIHQSSFPNASKFFTEKNEIIVSAIQPIKKGEQIFVNQS